MTTEAVPVITIDGPGGAGKGTVSILLARALDWHILDSGALYRVLALAAERQAIDLLHEADLEHCARHLGVSFQPADDPGAALDILLDGDIVTELVRTEIYGTLASKIASMPRVRAALMKRQRAFQKKPGLIADGRDMGTVVFPQALLKIFLDAAPAERAQRRYLQLKGKGLDVTLDGLLQDIMARDERDRARIVAPLRAAEDAIILDTTDMDIEAVLAAILNEAYARL